MPGVITNSESPTAADHDRITATRETLEDYTLRLAPRSYRRWPPAVVGISALGGIAYLADFAIGANVGITWGTANALCGIAIFALVVFVWSSSPACRWPTTRRGTTSTWI
ncbi:transmembrane protein [Mycobacterium tuberculosis TKK_04_0155]|nr:transmembrane protein [Mycobacterium tuberculosis TKK_04_0155]